MHIHMLVHESVIYIIDKLLMTVLDSSPRTERKHMVLCVYVY